MALPCSGFSSTLELCNNERVHSLGMEEWEEPDSSCVERAVHLLCFSHMGEPVPSGLCLRFTAHKDDQDLPQVHAQKRRRQRGAEGLAQLVDWWLCVHETLCYIHGTTKSWAWSYGVGVEAGEWSFLDTYGI